MNNNTIVEKTKKHMKIFNILILLLIILVIATMLILKITSPKQSNPSQEDFSKGLLALNTDKSVYIPGESVELGIASLDPKGNTLCHSNLALTVSGPRGQKIILSTENGKIINNCSVNESSTDNPDYRSNFVPEKEGTYNIQLTNLDSKMKVKDQISVKNNQQYSLKRTGPSKVNPLTTDRYPMILTVTTQKDFKGELVDQIPSSFDVVWQGTGVIETVKDYKTITWNVNLKTGETKEFIYEFQAPKVAPKFYDLGKAILLENNNKIFEESKLWEIIVGGSSN
jgi:hypothetical protein